MINKHIQTGLKLLFSVAVLFILFHEVHFLTILPYLRQITPEYYVASTFLLLTANVIASYRWYLIMNKLGMPAPLHFFIKSYLQGMMFNQILPTSVGGDAYRIIEVAQRGYPKRDAINGVLTDRIYGFSGLVLMNLMVLGVAHQLYPLHIFIGVVITLIGCVGIVTFLASFHCLKHPFFTTRLRWIHDLSNTLKNTYGALPGFSLRLVLGILPNFLSVSAIALIAASMHIQAHAIDFFIIIPSVVLLTMIPISMAGWGIREGAMVFLGAAIGLPKPALLATSLLYGFMLILTSLPGLYFNLKKQFTAAQAEVE